MTREPPRRVAAGQVHGELLVLARIGTRGHKSVWSTRCTGCGTERPADTRGLLRGRLNSCACVGRAKRSGRRTVWEAAPPPPLKPPPPPPPKRRTRPVELALREMIRIGRELGLSPQQAMDAGRVSAALRRADPGHPGVIEAGRKLVGLGHGAIP